MKKIAIILLPFLGINALLYLVLSIMTIVTNGFEAFIEHNYSFYLIISATMVCIDCYIIFSKKNENK